MNDTPGAFSVVFALIIGAALFLAWLYALVDCLQSRFRRGVDKIAWLVAVILLPVVGTLLYLLFRRRFKLEPVHRMPHRALGHPVHRSDSTDPSDLVPRTSALPPASAFEKIAEDRQS